MKMMEVDEPTSCALYLISKLSDKKVIEILGCCLIL